MKAKFIKHNTARTALGVDVLSQRDFKSYNEFINWLYDYIVPSFYGIPKGRELWNKIKKIVKREDSYIPWDLLNYIGREIIPWIKINGEKDRIRSYYIDLRNKFPFSPYNSDIK